MLFCPILRSQKLREWSCGGSNAVGGVTDAQAPGAQHLSELELIDL